MCNVYSLLSLLEYDVTSPQDNLQNGIHNSVFKSAMATTPNPEVSLCWERHVKLLPGIHRLKGSEVAKWNIEQVAAFVKTLPGCEEHYKTFKEEVIITFNHNCVRVVSHSHSELFTYYLLYTRKYSPLFYFRSFRPH